MPANDRRVSRPAASRLPAQIDKPKHSPPLDDDGESHHVAVGVSRSRPVIGDDTFYTYEEAVPHLRISATTLRTLLRSGAIPRSFTTRVGRRVFMTGDQIARLKKFFEQSDAPVQSRPRRRKRVAA